MRDVGGAIDVQLLVGGFSKSREKFWLQLGARKNGGPSLNAVRR